MKSILSEIYEGEYSHLERRSPVESELVCALTNLEDEMLSRLSDDMREKFYKYTVLCHELYRVSCKEDFKEGFRLAVRLLKEAESDAEDDED